MVLIRWDPLLRSAGRIV